MQLSSNTCSLGSSMAECSMETVFSHLVAVREEQTALFDSIEVEEDFRRSFVVLWDNFLADFLCFRTWLFRRQEDAVTDAWRAVVESSGVLRDKVVSTSSGEFCRRVTAILDFAIDRLEYEQYQVFAHGQS